MPTLNGNELSVRELRKRYTDRIEQLKSERVHLSVKPLDRPADAVFKHAFELLVMFGLTISAAGLFFSHPFAAVTGCLLSLFGISILAFTSQTHHSSDSNTPIPEELASPEVTSQQETPSKP